MSGHSRPTKHGRSRRRSRGSRKSVEQEEMKHKARQMSVFYGKPPNSILKLLPVYPLRFEPAPPDNVAEFDRNCLANLVIGKVTKPLFPTSERHHRRKFAKSRPIDYLAGPSTYEVGLGLSSSDDEMDYYEYIKLAPGDRRKADFQRRLKLYCEQQSKIRHVLKELNIPIISPSYECSERLRPVLQYYVENMADDYILFRRSEAVTLVNRWKSEIRGRTPHTELQCKVVIEHMDVDHMAIILIHDIFACKKNGGNYPQFFQSEYLNLVFSDPLLPLTMSSSTPDYLKTVLEDSLFGEALQKTLDEHMYKHKALRERQSSYKEKFANPLEKELVEFYRSDRLQPKDEFLERVKEFKQFWTTRAIGAQIAFPSSQKLVMAAHLFTQLSKLVCTCDIYQLATIKLMEMTENRRGQGIPPILWKFLVLVFKIPEDLD